jgi:acetylornithine deacetylase
MQARVAQERVAEAVDLLAALVAFDTTSHRSNLDLIRWVADLLSNVGAGVSILPSPDGTKANLFATLGGARDGGVVLSAHTDVVPAHAPDWQSNPFELARRGERLHGRGTCDMKGFIACALAFALRFDATESAVPLHIALSYDEELGCLGVPGIVSELGRSLPRPALAIVGEPTSMHPITAHKGYRAFETNFAGVPAHSSRPGDGVSAIRIANAFMTALDRLAGELSTGVTVVGMEPACATLNVGRIEGGLATNVVAPHCRILWELRPVPGTDVDAALRRLDEMVGESLPQDLSLRDARTLVATRQTAAEPVFADRGGPAFRLARELTGVALEETAAYGSEAGFFHEAGLSTVIVGPGDVGQAHRIDEYIEMRDISAGLAFLDALGERLRTNGLDGL